MYIGNCLQLQMSLHGKGPMYIAMRPIAMHHITVGVNIVLYFFYHRIMGVKGKGNISKEMERVILL